MTCTLHVAACDGDTDGCSDGARSFDTVSVPEATLGEPYSAELEDIADTEWLTGLYEFGDALALPEGLTLDTVTLTLSGTPTESGSYTFVVNAYASEACLDEPDAHENADSHRFSIEVIDAGG